MSKIVDNQKKIIGFIKEIMELVEGEEFTSQKIDTFHQWYTVLGDNFYTGSLLVIANKQYMDLLEESKKDIEGPRPSKIDSSILDFQGSSKAININNDKVKSVVLKYSKKHNDKGEEYYKFKSVTNLKKEYPYLVKIVNALNSVTKEQENVDDIMKDLADFIESSKKDNVEDGVKKRR